MHRWKWLIAFLVFIAAAVQIHALYHKGVKAGMDQVVPEAIEDHTMAIAIAISDMVYNLHEGYLYYDAVYVALNKAGMTKNPQYLKNIPVPFPQNLRDGDLMNHALQNALNIHVPPKRSLETGDVHPMPATDIGLADYFKLGFALFGFNVAAAYKLYFVILSLSAIIFFIEFRDRPLYLLMALGLLSLLFILMDMMITSGDIDLATPYNFRCISSLTILPVLHLLLLMLDRRPASKSCLWFAGLQCAVLVFSFNARSSAAWGMLLLLIVASFYGLRAWRVNPQSLYRQWRDAWPLLLAVAGILMLGLINTIYNQQYILRHALTDHPFWGLWSSLLPALLVAGIIRYCTTYLYRNKHHRNYMQALRVTLSSLKTAAVWPVLLMMGVSLVYTTYVAWRTHPVYSTEHVIPHHMRYHNAFLGLTLHPQFYPRFSKEMGSGGINQDIHGDWLGYNAAYRELAQDYPTTAAYEFISPYTNTFCFGLEEYYMRKALLKFIARHPLFALEAEWYKFIGLWQLWYQYAALNPLFQKLLIVSAALAPLTLLGLSQKKITLQQVGNSAVATLLMGLFVQIPLLYAYPAIHVCPDQILVLSFMVLFTPPLLACLAGCQLLQRMQPAMGLKG